MRKWLSCMLILAAIPILSFGGLGGEDVSKLRPVQVIALDTNNNCLRLQTDTDDLGIGQDVSQAIRNMKETSPAGVFLDTADYLLIKPGGEIWLQQLMEYLRPSCSVCYASEEVDLKQVSSYLQYHEPRLTLIQYEAGERQLPFLICEDGRMKVVQP